MAIVKVSRRVRMWVLSQPITGYTLLKYILNMDDEVYIQIACIYI